MRWTLHTEYFYVSVYCWVSTILSSEISSCMFDVIVTSFQENRYTRARAQKCAHIGVEKYYTIKWLPVHYCVEVKDIFLWTGQQYCDGLCKWLLCLRCFVRTIHIDRQSQIKRRWLYYLEVKSGRIASLWFGVSNIFISNNRLTSTKER